MHAHEEALIRAFIIPTRRARWLTLLGSTKRRRRFLNRLNHCRDIDERYATPLPSNVNVVACLQSRGAPSTCFVVSDSSAIDGRELPLAEAIGQAELDGWGTLVSCLPGLLAYYQDEAGTRRRWLLERKSFILA
jgi:hypothetical protein